MAPRMVQELEEEVDEAPVLPPEPNHLEKTLTDIKKVMDTFADLMAMQTQQNLQVAYQLKDIADLWFKGVEKSRPEDAPPIIWAKFKKIFIKKWLPPGVRAALAILFETLNQDTMIVLKYSIKFEKLSCYAPHIFPTEDEKIDRFARGLISGIRKDTASRRRNATFTDFINLAMDLERIYQEERDNREQNKKARNFGTFSAVPSSGKGQNNRGSSGPPQSRMQTTFSSPPVAYNFEQGGQFRSIQSEHRTAQQGQSSVGSY
uniref:Uncharacterized protein LOC104221595 n=1 Tax=Nicotiana sylvestris TaxID=4096 RepID=A0A1U7W9Q0_NICSY|nr:PREDICTED: uncharacterized protein LOC104221595 [Nicotiana sylvestris]